MPTTLNAAEHLPGLYRLAQALEPYGSDRGEALVRAALERARLDLVGTAASIRTKLYAHLIAANRVRCQGAARRRAGDGLAARPLPGGHGRNNRDADHPTSDLRGAIDGLSLQDREALLLVVLDGLDYVAVGDILDAPPSTVAVRVARARAALTPASVAEPAQPPIRVPYLRLVK